MSANNYWTADGWPGWSADGWSEWSADGWFGYDIHVPAVDVVVLETSSPTFTTQANTPLGGLLNLGGAYFLPLLPPPSAVLPDHATFAVLENQPTPAVQTGAAIFKPPDDPSFT